MKYMSAIFYSSVCSNLNQSQNLKFNHTQDRSKTRKVESKFFLKSQNECSYTFHSLQFVLTTKTAKKFGVLVELNRIKILLVPP